MGMDPNKYYYEEKETLDNWNRYINDSHERSSEMWNTILYNQFVNEEIRRLNRKIYYLKDDLQREKQDNEKNELKINNLKKEIQKIKPIEKKKKYLDTAKWLS